MIPPRTLLGTAAIANIVAEIKQTAASENTVTEISENTVAEIKQTAASENIFAEISENTVIKIKLERN